MTKHEAITSIGGLYPSDSEFPKTNEIGRKFMLQAMDEVRFNWRELPENVLTRWAELCEAKEAHDQREFERKYR
jgi:hypothetical protein